MYGALYIGATGLKAQESKIKNIAHDISNVHTIGYKKGELEFNELLSQTLKAPGEWLGAATQTPVGVQIGTGVKIGTLCKNFQSGTPKITENPYDLMINGTGFFSVQTSQGEISYTRSGLFHLNSQGALQLSNGGILIPQITIPSHYSTVRIEKDGQVKVEIPGEGEKIVGQIQVITFQNEQGLMSLGEGLYQSTSASGSPITNIPGDNKSGTLLQGVLEESNVDIVSSMITMLESQRAYEMSAKLITVVDQMLGATANIV